MEDGGWRMEEQGWRQGGGVRFMTQDGTLLVVRRNGIGKARDAKNCPTRG